MRLASNDSIQIESNPTNLQVFYLPAYLILTLVIFAGCFYLYLYQPSGYLAFIIEDGIGEYLTTTFYVAATIFLIRHISCRQTPAFGYYLLLSCFIFMAGEEISWGQRLFGYGLPEILLELNAQDELTLHNLVSINRLLPILAWSVLLWAIITPVLPRLDWFQIIDRRMGIPIARSYQIPLFFLAALFMYQRPFYQGAELGELLLGFFVLLLLSCALLRKVHCQVSVHSCRVFNRHHRSDYTQLLIPRQFEIPRTSACNKL